MKIGELASASATSIETIRYYERENLLPAPARTEGNFRMYEPAHLQRLQFIRYCRTLDMSLDEVRTLLRVKDAPTEDCGNVDAVIDTHIAHVSARIRELRSLEKELKALRQQCCSPSNGDQCGILAGLAVAAQEPVAGPRTQTHLR